MVVGKENEEKLSPKKHLLKEMFTPPQATTGTKQNLEKKNPN